MSQHPTAGCGIATGSLAWCHKHDAGWSSSVARRAHNPKVVGSNPTPATNSTRSEALSAPAGRASSVVGCQRLVNTQWRRRPWAVVRGGRRSCERVGGGSPHSGWNARRRTHTGACGCGLAPRPSGGEPEGCRRARVHGGRLVRTSLPALRVSRSGRHRVTGMAVKATRSGVASIDECRVPPPSGLSKPQYVHEGGPTPGSNGRTPQLTIQLGRDLIHEHGSGGGAGGEQLRCRAVHRARQGSSAAHAGDEQLGVGDRVHGRQGP